ncbi:MAG TPA: hypothetical protein VGB59_01580 [Allosphingosinicella sp.]|jgi:hypothetical protein
MSAGGGTAGTAVTAAALAFGGYAFARMGWTGLRRRPTDPEPGRELATPAPSPAMKLVWGFCLLFGAFVLVCGLLLLVSAFVGEQSG